MEKIQGVDFSIVTLPEEVGLDSQTVHRSSPSGNLHLTNLLKDIGITESDSIIDIGAGKGSAMLAMSNFPFAMVDGVELSEHLANIARRNFGKLKMGKCHVYTGDAVTFQHYCHYNMFYLYNPFPCEIMARVLDNICRSTKDSNREILIIYNTPKCHKVIDSQGTFKKIKEYPNGSNRIFLYTNKGPETSRIGI
jgi:16S rRNA G966 N2-methylase RsmD